MTASHPHRLTGEIQPTAQAFTLVTSPLTAAAAPSLDLLPGESQPALRGAHEAHLQRQGGGDGLHLHGGEPLRYQ